MTVSATNSTAASTSAAGTSSKAASTVGAKAGMGKDDFMQLLVAQLKNQDPMKPMEDKEFITQLAQFSSLESMDKMTKQMEDLTGAEMLVQAATLIGKPVTAKLTSGEVVSGTIGQVKMIDGKATAVVNGTEIDTSLITTIGA
jgi:flagellar basal-body rod modification protein FlgD